MLPQGCFSAGEDLMPHAEVLTRLRRIARTVAGTEHVGLLEAAGRIAGQDVIAPRPVPSTANAAVDGYAVRTADLSAETGSPIPPMRIAGRATAGRPFTGVVAPGECLRVLTGAPVPDTFDCVFMQEDVALDGDETSGRMTPPRRWRSGDNIRAAGEDRRAGDTVVAAGTLLRPVELAALASLGFGTVAVRAPLRVGVASTGNELLQPGAPFQPAHVYDSNAPLLHGLLSAPTFTPVALGAWPDEGAGVRARLEAACATCDVVLTSGGASGSEEDHIARALADLGERHVWRIAVKPGRPLLFGQVGDAVVVGLPGNTVAVLVCFLIYVWPLLRAMGGAPWPEPQAVTLPALFAVPRKKPGRREFWRARLATGVVEGASVLGVEKFARDGSGLISGLTFADGLVEIDEQVTSVARGDPVRFLPYSGFGMAAQPTVASA